MEGGKENRATMTSNLTDEAQRREAVGQERANDEEEENQKEEDKKESLEDVKQATIGDWELGWDPGGGGGGEDGKEKK